jgi:prepilin-type N-terminal cleavage/methylation domain-containing protein
MRDNKGFTLIELLIVVVIIGILAAIAIPKFIATKEKGYFAAMKSDLKNLEHLQEIYYSDNYAYTTVAADLKFTTTDGVIIIPSITATSSGWSATATHAELGTAEGCAMFYGTATAPTTPTAPTQPGEVNCTS